VKEPLAAGRYPGSPVLAGTGLRLRVSAGLGPDFPCTQANAVVARPSHAARGGVKARDSQARRSGTVAAMAWTWRYEKADGSSVEVEPASPSFPTQGDAETWVGEVWRDLLAAGVDAVTLLEDQRTVYGPMSLHPPTG